MKQIPLSCFHEKIVCDQDRGEKICVGCAEVIEQKMNDEHSELYHNNFAENARTGPATSLTMYDRGLFTIMGKGNHDATGKPFSYKMQHNVKRMRLWDSRSKTQTSSTSNLRMALVKYQN